MTNKLFKKWLAAALCLGALGSTAALAQPDTFYLGNGHEGDYTVPTNPAGIIINSYAPVNNDITTDAERITVGNCVVSDTRTGKPCFDQGDLVMVLQTTDSSSPGTGGVVDIRNGEVGRWQLARVTAWDASTGALTLTPKLGKYYPKGVTQVIRVPEYKTLRIPPGSSLKARAWNPVERTGGVLAFLATGTVDNQGSISANTLGFWGGPLILGKESCTPGSEESAQGEGIASESFLAKSRGRSNVANGGGGGACLRAGGGGGGNRGAGGQGGFTRLGQNFGGLGGASLTYSLEDRLLMGGGGGAGHVYNGPEGYHYAGEGGGIVFIRARQLIGKEITANGGLGVTSQENAGSGGGGGGSIYLRVVEPSSCDSLQARGGSGGSSNGGWVGPGGGGGGGTILLQAPTGSTCTTLDVRHGSAGLQFETQPDGGRTYGAEPGADGGIETPDGGFAPPPPVVINPANGAVTNAYPQFAGTAAPDVEVHVVVDDTREAIPVLSEDTGAWTTTLPLGDELVEGEHKVTAYSKPPPLPDGGVSSVASISGNTNNFRVDITPPDTVIDSGPRQPTGNVRNTPFVFRSTEPDSTFMCRVGLGSEATGSYSPCNSPYAYTATVDGTYTFQVYATDAAGNPDRTPASYTWTVDTAPPTAPVITAPANGATVAIYTPLITGTAEPGSSVTLILDGTAKGPVTADALGQWSYVSERLALGVHEVRATAKDPAGNTSPESATNRFTVVQDTSAPDTAITSGPSGTVSETSATFTFISNEPGVTYECSLDEPLDEKSKEDSEPCTSPKTYTGLSTGEHTFWVRARDAADNVDPSSASRTWTVFSGSNNFSFRGKGIGCSTTGGDASLVVMVLGTMFALVRRHRARR